MTSPSYRQIAQVQTCTAVSKIHGIFKKLHAVNYSAPWLSFTRKTEVSELQKHTFLYKFKENSFYTAPFHKPEKIHYKPLCKQKELPRLQIISKSINARVLILFHAQNLFFYLGQKKPAEDLTSRKPQSFLKQVHFVWVLITPDVL